MCLPENVMVYGGWGTPGLDLNLLPETSTTFSLTLHASDHLVLRVQAEAVRKTTSGSATTP